MEIKLTLHSDEAVLLEVGIEEENLPSVLRELGELIDDLGLPLTLGEIAAEAIKERGKQEKAQ